MKYVRCDNSNCKHCKNGFCKLDILNINEYGKCEDKESEEK